MSTPLSIQSTTSHLTDKSPAARLTIFPKDGLGVLLFILVVLILSRAHTHFPGLSQLQPVLLAGVGAVVMMVLTPGRVRLDLAYRYWPGKVMLALLLLAVVGAPFGIHMWGSLSTVVREYVKIVGVAFLVMVALRSTGDLYTFVWAHVVATGVLVFFSAFIFQMESQGGVVRLGSMYMYDSNDLGSILATTLPLTVLAFETARNRTARWIAAGILFGTAIALARTGSRGGFIGAVVVVGVLLVTMRHIASWKRLAVLVLGIGVLGAAAPTGYWDRMESLTEPTEDYNWDDYYGRRKVAERGIDYMLDRPLFGVGIGNFPRADATIPESSRIRGHRKWRAPHNSFVQIGSELGIPGLALFASLVFGGMISLRRIRRRLPRSWLHEGHERRFLYLFSIHVPVAFLGFGVTSFFLSFAYLVPVYLLAALLVGFYASLRKVIANGGSDDRRTIHTPAVRDM